MAIVKTKDGGFCYVATVLLIVGISGEDWFLRIRCLYLDLKFSHNYMWILATTIIFLGHCNDSAGLVFVQFLTPDKGRYLNHCPLLTWITCFRWHIMFSSISLQGMLGRGKNLNIDLKKKC